jgi:RNA polymerase-binding protein DksA
VAKKAPKKAKKSKKTAGKKARKATAKKKSAKKPRKSSKAKAKPSGKSRKSKRKVRAKTPLSRKELQEFRELLLAKRRDLLGDMAGIQGDAISSSRHENSGGNMPTHPADIGSDNYEQEFSLELLESERILLQEIDEALHRINEGTYGLCLGTGKPIGLPRLRARPWAKYCIDYQRMIEKGLVRPPTNEEEDEEEPGEDLDEEDEESAEEEPPAEADDEAEADDDED